MEIDYIESLRKQKEDAWETFNKAREDYNNAMCKNIKKNLKVSLSDGLIFPIQTNTNICMSSIFGIH